MPEPKAVKTDWSELAATFGLALVAVGIGLAVYHFTVAGNPAPGANNPKEG